MGDGYTSRYGAYISDSPSLTMRRWGDGTAFRLLDMGRFAMGRPKGYWIWAMGRRSAYGRLAMGDWQWGEEANSFNDNLDNSCSAPQKSADFSGAPPRTQHWCLLRDDGQWAIGYRQWAIGDSDFFIKKSRLLPIIFRLLHKILAYIRKKL